MKSLELSPCRPSALIRAQFRHDLGVKVDAPAMMEKVKTPRCKHL